MRIETIIALYVRIYASKLYGLVTKRSVMAGGGGWGGGGGGGGLGRGLEGGGGGVSCVYQIVFIIEFV